MMRRSAAALCALALAAGLAACSGGSGSRSVSVFTVVPGECFDTPSSITAELSSLPATACNDPHTQEAYAIVPYKGAGASVGQGTTLIGEKSALSAYPGEDVLTTFANGACAQRFQKYVGVDYLDSKLFFTYLLPSARSWESDDDRNVICFITTTGGKLTASVKNSKR